jgi:hypothetical protein
MNQKHVNYYHFTIDDIGNGYLLTITSDLINSSWKFVFTQEEFEKLKTTINTIAKKDPGNGEFEFDLNNYTDKFRKKLKQSLKELKEGILLDKEDLLDCEEDPGGLEHDL